MNTVLDKDDQDALAYRILSTLPTAMGHVRILVPDRDGYRHIRFEANRSGNVFRHRSVDLPPSGFWGREVTEKGRRLFVVRHEDRAFSRECVLPILFGVNILGWIGAPLPRMEYWNRFVRNSWARWIQNYAERVGGRMVRSGLLPEIETDGPIIKRKSLMEIASRISDSGEGFGMYYVRPDRLEMADALADLLRSTVRAGDAVGVGDTGAAALCIGGIPDGIKNRLTRVVSDAVELDWRLSGEIRFGYCLSGSFRDVAVQHVRPVGRVVFEPHSPLAGTFRRLGLTRASDHN
jgi:hypothetical protein